LSLLPRNENFGTDSSGVLAVGVLKRKVNIAVCFHFCVDDAASKGIPFLFGWQPRFCVIRAGKSNRAALRPPLQIRILLHERERFTFGAQASTKEQPQNQRVLRHSAFGRLL
jgi:hypothetical protein